MRRIFLSITFIFTICMFSLAHGEQLANEATMRKQLESVTDDTYLNEKYFPLILQHVDSEKVPLGIVMMFESANSDYFDEVLEKAPLPLKVSSKMLLDMLIPKFIYAILPNNSVEAEEAVKIWAELHPAPEKKKDQKVIIPPGVCKAFIITGGTEEQRKKKYYQFIHSDEFLMYAAYKSEDGTQLAVMFADEHEAFKSTTFSAVKQWAGNKILPASFCTSTFENEDGFGVIDLDK